MHLAILLAVSATTSIAFLTLPATTRWCTIRGVWRTVIACRVIAGVLAATAAFPLLLPHDRPVIETEDEMFYAFAALALMAIAVLPILVIPLAIEMRKAVLEEPRRHSWGPVALLVPVVYVAGEVVWYAVT